MRPFLLPLVLAAAVATLPACGVAEPEERPAVVGRGDVELPPDSEIRPARVPANATLAGMLAAHALHATDVVAIVQAAGRTFDLRKLRVGQPWRIERTVDGCVRFLEYEIDPERYLLVSRHGGDPHEFTAAVKPYDVSSETVVVEGAIEPDGGSLFGAMEAAGETVDLPVALADVFAGEIDFNSELQPGDRFRLLVEKRFREGRLVRYGAIEAAEFVNDGRTLVAVRFAPPGSPAGYYDAQGKSLKRFFLRSPLRFEPRITSRFSHARMHPVLHTVRAHLGVDYGAPVGAPVVAAAHGVVTVAGWRGGGGRTVGIRHASGYESYYLHLSSVAAGVVPGARVSQGQVIGKVGATGLASGPHLDYRIKKNGAYVNPLAVLRTLPPGDPIAPQHMAAFEAVRDATLARLAAHDPEMKVASLR